MHFRAHSRATIHKCVGFLRGLPVQLCLPLLLVTACATLLPADSIHPYNTLGVKPLPNIQPGPVGDQYRLGITAFNKGDLPAAEAAFKKVLQVDPHMLGAYFMLAQISIRQGKNVPAGEYLRQAVQMGPTTAMAHLLLGRYFIVTRDFAAAEAELKKAASLDTADPAAMISLGDVYASGLKNQRQALAAYRKALARDPSLVGVHMEVAALLAATGDTRQALAELDATAKQASGDPMPFILKAQIFAASRRFSDALTAYRNALQQSPRQAAAYTGMGMVYQQMQLPAQAQDAYRKAIALDPNQEIALNNLAWMAAEQKRELDQALLWSQKAVQLEPSNPGFEDTMAWVLRARGELDKADATLQKASLMKPYSADVFYHLGIVKTERGQTGEAAAALQRALTLSPTFAGAADARARIAALQAAHKSSER